MFRALRYTFNKRFDIMNDEMNKHKSPFAKYDDGAKTRKPLTYAPSEDFKRTFLKFIDKRFNSVSSAIDLMVKDYIFKYAFESKGYYEKTIVCVLSKGEIHHALEDDAYEPVDYERFKDFPLPIHKVGILNRHAKSKFDDEVVDNEMVENYELIAALVHDKSYGDVDLITKDFVYNNYTHSFLHSLEEDAIVLEIALNNNLDANFNDVYCFENDDGTFDENKHVGVNIVNLGATEFHVDAFPIIYYWSLDQDFNVVIQDIFKITNDDLVKLVHKYCEDMGDLFTILDKLIEIGTGYEIRLKEELEHKKELERKLYNSEQRIKRLRKAIDIDKKVNN